jgi:hypothetical protein
MESCLHSINDFTNPCAQYILKIFETPENITSAGKTSRQFAVVLAVTTVALTLLSVSAGTFGFLKAITAVKLTLVAYDLDVFSKNTEGRFNISHNRWSCPEIATGKSLLENTILLLPIFNSVFTK